MAEVNNIIKKNKTISIKNKKAAKETLAKASIKGKSTAKKVIKKASTVKTPVKAKTIDEKELTQLIETPIKEEKNVSEKAVKKETKTTAKKTTKTSPKTVYKEKTAEKKKKSTIKEPNNIIRKLPKEETNEVKEKEEVKKESKEEIVKTKRQLKREEKKKQRLEKRKIKREKKAKQKEEKKKLREKELKEKKLKKEKKNKTKIEIPKEWKTINTKNGKAVQEDPKTFKGKIKSSIFESIDEKELKERKKKSKESFKKTLIVLLIIAVIVGVAIYSLLKYNDFVKKQLAVYDAYRIGDVVYLKDESLWYVIEDSDSKKDSVKLLSNKFADINLDGNVDGNDLVQYHKENSAEFSADDENSVAYLLKKTIKAKYEENIGKIKEISIISSKEYVKIRERMNFGDEWTTENWLAGPGMKNYWIESEKNNKVYVVTEKGTFYLSEPNKTKYVRPTIVIKKEAVTKVEEKRKISVDLINGLKRK